MVGGGWQLVAVGGWRRLAVGGGWQLVAVGDGILKGCAGLKKSGFFRTVLYL